MNDCRAVLVAERRDVIQARREGRIEGHVIAPLVLRDGHARDQTSEYPTDGLKKDSCYSSAGNLLLKREPSCEDGSAIVISS